VYEGVDDSFAKGIVGISRMLHTPSAQCLAKHRRVALHKTQSLFDEAVFDNVSVRIQQRNHRATKRRAFPLAVILFGSGIGDGIDSSVWQEPIWHRAEEQHAADGHTFTGDDLGVEEEGLPRFLVFVGRYVLLANVTEIVSQPPSVQICVRGSRHGLQFSADRPSPLKQACKLFLACFPTLCADTHQVPLGAVVPERMNVVAGRHTNDRDVVAVLDIADHCEKTERFRA